jgi:hypothetical protein
MAKKIPSKIARLHHPEKWAKKGPLEPSSPCPEFTLFPKKCQKDLSDMSPEFPDSVLILWR